MSVTTKNITARLIAYQQKRGYDTTLHFLVKDILTHLKSQDDKIALLIKKLDESEEI